MRRSKKEKRKNRHSVLKESLWGSGKSDMSVFYCETAGFSEDTGRYHKGCGKKVPIFVYLCYSYKYNETENGKKAEKRKEMERQRMFCGNGSVNKQKE